MKFAYVEKKQYLCKLFAQICAYTREEGENGKLKGEERDKNIAWNDAAIGDANGGSGQYP